MWRRLSSSAVMRVSIPQLEPKRRENGRGPRRGAPMLWTPCLVRSSGPDGEVRASLGDPLVDDYLRFVAARSRPNTVLATAYDLKVFFSVVGKEPARVSTTDVMEFLAVQRAPRRGARVVRLEDGESGLSARTLKRRLASVSGFFAYLLARDDVDVRRNPVPHGVGARRPLASGCRGAPRATRPLPRSTRRR